MRHQVTGDASGRVVVRGVRACVLPQAIMDQLVKDKLDADKAHRDEALDLKEAISQLETKLHIDKTGASQEVRRTAERLTRFCEWVADQRISVAVQTTLGNFKRGSIVVLDSATGTATVAFADGSEESEVSLNRISFSAPVAKTASPERIAAAADAVTPVKQPAAAAPASGGGGGALEKLSDNERTMMVFLPLAVFPVVVVALASALNMAYSV